MTYRQASDVPRRASCARCGDEGDDEIFFHSGDGLVCPRCHQSERHEDRRRTSTSWSTVDCAMNGMFALACGVGSAIFSATATLVPMRAIPLFALAVAGAMAGTVRAYRSPPSARARRVWILTACAGCLLAVGSILVLVARLP